MSLKDRIRDPIGWLIEKIATSGMEQLFERYYGTYRAIVIDNEDEEERGRIRVLVPALGHVIEDDVPNNVYALPCMAGLSKNNGVVKGLFVSPEVGDQVWVTFEGGRSTNPVYMGGWMPSSATSNVFGKRIPKISGIRTKGGHELKFDDDSGSISLLLGDKNGSFQGSTLVMAESGDIVVATASGAQIFMNNADGQITLFGADGSHCSVGDGYCSLINKSGTSVSVDGKDVDINASGNITLASGGKITLKANSVDIGNGPVYQPVIKGTTFASIWSAHSHVCAAPGTPTVPASTIPPTLPSVAVLSTTVKIS